MKTTIDFRKMKENKQPIAMMTAYDAPSARIVEQAGMDMILVGDSLGMVVLGYDSTVPVTLDDMTHHTKAVCRGSKDTFVVTDMPFLTYHSSLAETIENAKQLLQVGGAHAVKLEGNGEVFTMISHLTKSGVPAVAHLGLTPQSVGVLGGYRVQAKDAESAKQLLEDARAAEEAGAFALVLECVPKQIASYISSVLTIPVIGIGAGVDTDGQVLVYHDIIGYGGEFVPKFVKTYTDITPAITEAVQAYVHEVRASTFPEESHTFSMNDEQLRHLYGGVK